jgi:hypothetical protein
MLPVRRITTIGATALVLAVPAAAAAQQQDLRAPDRQDPGTAAQIQDLRAPDRYDAGKPAEAQDLRAPDRQDPAPLRQAPAVSAPIQVSAPSAGSGFEWGDAGIGAAGMLGFVGIVAGVGLLAFRHRRDRLTVPSH